MDDADFQTKRRNFEITNVEVEREKWITSSRREGRHSLPRYSGA